MPTPEELVQAQLEAYNRQDIEAFLACYHEDCEFIDWPGKVLLRGHDQWRPRYLALWASSPRLKASVLNRMVVGRHVVDLELMEHVADGPRAPAVVVYEADGERLRRVWALRDSS